MKVSELSGTALDYWVAKAMGLPLRGDVWHGDGVFVGHGSGDLTPFAPSTDWIAGGPLIESRRVAVQPSPSGWDALVGEVFDDWDGLPIAPYGYGPTPLVAAMRAIIVSVYGDEVQS